MRIKGLLLATCGAWIVGMAAALIAFHTFSTAADPLAMDYASRLSLGFALTAIIGMGASRLIFRKLWSEPLCLVLAGLLALMFIGVAVNMAGYLMVPGASWESPALSRDPAYAYSLALLELKSPEAYGSFNGGYPLLLALLFRVGGTSLLLPLAVNVLAMFFSAAICARVCTLLLAGRTHWAPSRIAWIAALLFALIPNVAYMGTMLMKDALLTLGVSLFILFLAQLYTGKFTLSGILCCAAGSLLVMLLRSPYGWVLLLGVIMVGVHALIQKRSITAGPTQWGLMFGLICCMAIVSGGSHYRSYSDTQLFNPADPTQTRRNMLSAEVQKAGAPLFDGYYAASPLERAAYLPVTAAMQFLTPLPWNYSRDAQMGRFVPWARVSVLWYLVGGLALAYFAMCIWKRGSRGGLLPWSLWWLACYLGAAFVSAGTVARYYLPFMAAMVPMAVWVLYALANQLIRGRYFRKYCLVYGVLLIAGLAIAYKMQKG